MNEKQMEKVLAGDLTDLPTLNARVVRIFTSSTFTDTTEERNLLIEEVYPKLKDYCRNQHGLEFQVVDMRWGVRDEATDDHSTTELCLQEVINCQQLSLGPNFVTFLGQRHGSKTFPSVIAEDEFEILMKECEENSHKIAEWVSQWFQLDENAIPPQYILKPISTSFPNFLSNKQEEKKTARESWQRIHQQLFSILKKACHQCVDNGTLSPDTFSKYSMSVTELEIEQGIFKSSADPNAKCLCFVRIIDDIDNNLEHPKAWRYIDMTDSLIDQESQKQLLELRDIKIPQKLMKENVHRSNVIWHLPDGGIHRNIHKDYLNQFSIAFYKAVMKLIDSGARAQEALACNELLVEVVQHSNMAEARVKVFQGRGDIINSMHSLLTDGSRYPLVIHGESGCGKTSVMAACSKMVSSWVTEKQRPVIIVRFLGTSPRSSNIANTLQSVSHQLAVNLNIKEFIVPTDASDIVRIFHELLEKATNEKPIYIFLDSLDQLSAKNGAYTLGWMPRTLPEHAYLVISTLPSYFDILYNLHAKLPNDRFVEVKALGQNLSSDIHNSWLTDKKRKLTDSQQNIVIKAFQSCSLPLYVKLVFEQAVNWKSYESFPSVNLSPTVQTVISDLFSRLEMKHGQLFVSHALGYITASKHGLSESEWEDVLSLDDTVLEDVFQYHIPPVRRIPQVLLLRLRHDISQYIVTREADNRNVIYWYHRQFIQAAHQRFLTKKQIELHGNLADYFLGKWHNKEKSFIYNDFHVQKLGLLSASGKADRLVPDQPIKYGSGQEYNLRKLNNLPWHLLQSRDLENLNNQCLFNLEFLQSKLIASGVQAVLNDLEEAQENSMYHSELAALRSTISQTRASLNKYSDLLPIELSGRLLPLADTYPNIMHILEQCYQVGTLLPIQTCYPSPGGALVQTLEHKDLPVKTMNKYMFVANNGKQLLALTETSKIIMWDLINGDIERELLLWHDKEDKIKFNLMKRTASKELLLTADTFQKSGNPVVIYDITNDCILFAKKLEKVYKSVGFIDTFLIDASREHIVIFIKNKQGDVFDMKGQVIKHFEQVGSFMKVTPSGKSMIYPVGKGLSAFDLKSVTPWATMIETSDTPDFIQMALCSNFIYIGYKSLSKIDVIELNEDSKSNNKKVTIDFEKEVPKGVEIHAIKTSIDEKYLLISANMRIIMLDTIKYKVYRAFHIPLEAKPDHNAVQYQAKLDNSNGILVAVFDERLIVFNVLHGRVIRHIHASKTPMAQLHAAYEHMFLTANLKNRHISMWNADDIEMDVNHPLSLQSSTRYLEAARSGTYIAIRGFDAQDTRVLDSQTGKFISEMPARIESMSSHITDDGKYVVLTEYNMEVHAIHVCEASTGIVVATIPVSMISFKVGALGSPPLESNGQYLLATHAETSPIEDVKTSIWELNTGSHIMDVQAKQGGLSKMEFVADQRYLITLQQYPQILEGRQCTIHVYDLHQEGTEIYSLEGFLKDILFVIPNTDHIMAIKAHAMPAKDAYDPKLDDTLIIDVPTQKIISKSKICPTYHVYFSDDGKRQFNNNLKVFDVDLGDELADFHELYEDTSKVARYKVDITRNGRFAVWIIEQEGVIKVADIDSKQLIGKAFSHALPTGIVVSKNDTIAVGCDDGRVMLLRIWEPGKSGGVTVLEQQIQLKHEDIWKGYIDLVKFSEGSDRCYNDAPPTQQVSTCCSIL